MRDISGHDTPKQVSLAATYVLPIAAQTWPQRLIAFFDVSTTRFE